MKTFALHSLSFVIGFSSLVIGDSSFGASDGIIFFEQKIRPVLIEHCYSCHSATAKNLKGNLYLDSKAGWEKGGDSGAAVIVPGATDASLLLRTVQHLEAGLEMPPDKPKLPEAVIADLVTWVSMGAPDPRDGVKLEAKRGDKSWWSLQPLVKQFQHDSMDGFVTAKLAEQQLTLSPPADPRTLIRRMTYDVTGLPPTMEEVEAFVRECSGEEGDKESGRQAAIERLVTRLLNSPRYGERWGRHWLDVIRFGESNGFERNFVIDDLWPFRDYVIKAINDDKPFDQFIAEHLAGDVIGKDNPQVEVASAFLVAGPYDDVGNQSIEAQKNIRAATLDDIITATSGAFLGLTINCARCHHHKFDPIATEDYYRLRAAFEGTEHGRRVVATKEAREAHAAATLPLHEKLTQLEAERDTLDQSINTRAEVLFAKTEPSRPKIDENGTDETFPPIEARYVRFVIRGLTSDHHDKAKNGTGGKLTEFQVWSADEPARNVALASHGTTAAGAQAATADDFPEAYGPQYCIDGTLGEAWFIGQPAELTLTFARPERIARISFINARGERGTDEGKVRGSTPTEYEVQVSPDGSVWQTVATNEGRAPWTPAHGIAQARRTNITADETSHLATLDRQIAQSKASINRVPKLPEMWVGNHTQPAERTFVHKGGDPMQPAEAVVPASLAVLDAVTQPYELNPDADEGQRRLALAKWITQGNPLTARVLANRVWQYHFGTGLVDTPSDFGFLGSQPTHPELLDFLAQRLITHGWKLKALHREILLSQTYQQASSENFSSGMKLDKDSRLLWRFPPRRLSAEEVRDTMLHVAGKLQLEPMGGPGFRLYKFTQNNVCTYLPLDTHGPETYRRAVYHQNARASVVDVLNDFDLPDIAFAAPKRVNTTTPLQALTLLNHRFTLDMAAALAARIQTGDVVTQAYRVCFQREPTVKEHAAASLLIAQHGAESFCRALLNSNELLYLE